MPKPYKSYLFAMQQCLLALQNYQPSKASILAILWHKREFVSHLAGATHKRAFLVWKIGCKHVELEPLLAIFAASTTSIHA